MLKGMIKAKDEEMLRVRQERVLSAGVSVPVVLGCTSQHMGVFTNSEPLGPCDFLDFCGGFITCAVC